MKKLLMILLVVALLCIGGGAVFAQASNLGAFKLELKDNFQYGDGYQGQLTQRNLMNGRRTEVGDTYTLTFKFTASRDLEDDLIIGFVDTTEAAKYWTALSWDEAQGINPIQIENVKAGQEYTVNTTIKMLKRATSANGAANALVFTTVGEGTKGRANSGVKKAVTLDIKDFVLTKTN